MGKLPSASRTQGCLLWWLASAVFLVLLIVSSVIHLSYVASSQHCIHQGSTDNGTSAELGIVPVVSLDVAATSIASPEPCPITPETACFQAFKDVEDENAELQVQLRHNMDVYKQMVTSMIDFIGIAQAQASSGWLPLDRCVTTAQDRYNQGMSQLNASLFQSHAAKEETLANAQSLRKLRFDSLFNESDANQPSPQ